MSQKKPNKHSCQHLDITLPSPPFHNNLAAVPKMQAQLLHKLIKNKIPLFNHRTKHTTQKQVTVLFPF